MNTAAPWPLMGTLTTSSATIIKAGHTMVYVRIGESCASNKSCGHSCSCGHSQPRQAKRTVAVATSPSTNFAPGDQVRIRHFTPNPSFAAVLIFGLPLLFCAVELLLWNALSGGAQGNGIEALACVSALCLGIGAGFGIEWLLEARYPSTIITAAAT